MSNTGQPPESTFAQNEFGTVTNRRIVYYRNKGWLSGGSRQDIPLQHITSVRLDTSRNLVGGIILLLIGLAMLSAVGDAKILAPICITLAVILLWGSPLVVVNTAGGDLNAAKGWPWHRGKASAFVEALRDQLFNRSNN